MGNTQRDEQWDADNADPPGASGPGEPGYDGDVQISAMDADPAPPSRAGGADSTDPEEGVTRS